MSITVAFFVIFTYLVVNADMVKKKVFISGCFDMLHSGHIAFFEEAASYGDVYLGLGSDSTIYNLKNRKTVYTDEERLYIASSIKYIRKAWINQGSGTLDFINEIRELKPDIFFVNSDGDSNAKKDLCKQLGIDYIVSNRLPIKNMPSRSTTGLRTKSIIPYRLDLAGGWLDQPYVSKYHPGSVLTICVEPSHEFNDRSGMSSSTRKKAVEIWGYSLPLDDPEKLAKVLFSFENPPGKTEISGSQDSIGIVFPGLNKLHYEGNYWPDNIITCHDDEILDWIEERLHFIPLSPREGDYDVLSDTDITTPKAKNLAEAADNVWDCIMKKDFIGFGNSFQKSFEAQVAMFPNMVNEKVLKVIETYKESALGWKLSGAGGGGYLVLISETPIKESIKIRIQR